MKFEEHTSVADILRTADNSTKGYIVVADQESPRWLHDTFKAIALDADWLSEYQ